MTVYWVAQRLKNSRVLHDRRRSGRTQIYKHEINKKAFENDPNQGLSHAGNKVDTSILFAAIKLDIQIKTLLCYKRVSGIG